MTEQTNEQVKEKIKRFLIVGETLDGIFSFQELQVVNILTFVILLGSAIFSLVQSIMYGTFWWFLSGGFIIGAIYFGILFKTNITYAITKYRIIRLENDPISQWFFKSSRLIGFSDLHYEHVESINVGSGTVNMSRFYISLFGLAIGWLLLTQDSLEESGTFLTLVALLIIVASLVNVTFSLPLGGVRMEVQSISGEKMTFPEKATPEDFVDELIINCRTFLSYGAT